MIIQIIGRERINWVNRTVYDDEDLKALDAIDFGEAKTVESMTDEVINTLINEFLECFPKYFEDELTVNVVNAC
ncbi:MAG: hypothetical protein K6F11_05355 [Lachnospiraceae bacterium]|nr:hypothetical protein [Lachnospiraceae bacterium]